MACGTRIRSQTANSLTTAAGEPARVVEYEIEGSDEPLHRLLTTLVDPQRAPAVGLAALHRERWEIETACDELKTHLLGRHPILRAKAPLLVHQGIKGLLLARYAVRSFLREAAPEADEDPDRLSLTHAVKMWCAAGSGSRRSPLRAADGRLSKPCGPRSWRSAPSRAAARSSQRGQAEDEQVRGPASRTALPRNPPVGPSNHGAIILS